MKQKTSGLHVGKYREKPNFKTNLAATILPAVLIFCALASLLVTVTGLSSSLPLFASGLIFLALFAAAKHFRKEAILLPAALVILIVIVIFARATLLNGFGALWPMKKVSCFPSRKPTTPAFGWPASCLASSSRPSASPFHVFRLWPQRCSSSSPSRQASFISRRGFSCRRELRFCCWRGRKIPFPQSTFSCSAQLCLELPH